MKSKDTITVIRDYADEVDMHPFYCVKCGKCVCQIIGNARIILPGSPGSDEMPEAIDFMGRTQPVEVFCDGVRRVGDMRIPCNARYIL